MQEQVDKGHIPKSKYYLELYGKVSGPTRRSRGVIEWSKVYVEIETPGY